MTAPLALGLADHVAAIAARPLTPEVATRATVLLRDYLGVALGGAHEDSSIVLRRGLGALAPARSATAIGTTDRFGAPEAALANGAAAHALEMDDTHQGRSIHPRVTVW